MRFKSLPPPQWRRRVVMAMAAAVLPSSLFPWPTSFSLSRCCITRPHLLLPFSHRFPRKKISLSLSLLCRLPPFPNTSLHRRLHPICVRGRTTLVYNDYRWKTVATHYSPFEGFIIRHRKRRSCPVERDSRIGPIPRLSHAKYTTYCICVR